MTLLANLLFEVNGDMLIVNGVAESVEKNIALPSIPLSLFGKVTILLRFVAILLTLLL